METRESGKGLLRWENMVIINVELHCHFKKFLYAYLSQTKTFLFCFFKL